jgi:serpin B
VIRSISRILIVITLMGIVLTPPCVAQDREAGESVARSATGFAVDLYRQFAVREQRDGKNLFFSPYSIYTVLALMYGGAAGETSEQMADALHVQLEAGDFQDGLADIQEILDQIGERGAVELNIANSLWPQSGAALKPGFLELAGRYLAEIYPVDYRREPEEARGRINGWAEERTEGRIQEIVNWDLHPETHLLLANAIYFKGEWRWRFDESKTEIMPFYRLEDDPVEVPMMMQLGRFPFGMIDTVQILQLPYQGDDLSMIIVLPEDPQDLPRIEQRMSAEDILDLREKLWEQEIYVHLPRFRITSAFDLIKDQSLRALGMTRALDQRRAEFPGIAEPANWFSIQRFVHKAFVEVNEEGTEAAAVTVGGCFPAGTPVPTPEGLVPIEKIEAGTRVYAFDLAEGQWVTTSVAERRPWPFSGQLVTIQSGGETIEATWNHPFLVVRGEGLEARRVPKDLPEGEAVSTSHGRWVEARDIREGDVLLVRNGGNSTVTGTSNRTVTGEMYFLEIEGFHNHAVGRLQILVHNASGGKKSAGPLSFTADHPFLFFIQDEPTGSILFMGRVLDPTEE